MSLRLGLRGSTREGVRWAGALWLTSRSVRSSLPGPHLGSCCSLPLGTLPESPAEKLGVGSVPLKGNDCCAFRLPFLTGTVSR